VQHEPQQCALYDHTCTAVPHNNSKCCNDTTQHACTAHTSLAPSKPPPTLATNRRCVKHTTVLYDKEEKGASEVDAVYYVCTRSL
jgi:hypothetical protein